TAGADAEAAWFWSVAKTYIKGGGAYLMPMLDMEHATGTGATKTTISQWADEWCLSVSNLAFASGVAVKPVIYTSSSFAGTWLNSSVTRWTPWIADWITGANPQTGSPTAGTGPWSTWVVWQYDNGNANNPGDADVFNGTLTGLTNTLVIMGGDSAA